MTVNELFELVEKEEIKGLEQLLISHPKIINMEDNEESTLLSTAVNNNNLSAVKLLIDHKANLEKTYPVDNDTVLISAVYSNNYDIVKLLVESGADVNYQNDLGYDALYYASSKSYFKIQDFLLEHGADKTNFMDTSLIDASSKGDLERVEQFLREHIDVNLQNYEGKCALMQACSNGHFKVAQKLIDNGADIFMTTPDAKTAFFYAITKGNVETVKIFGDRKGSVSVISTDEECSKTALTFASEYGNTEVVKYLLSVDFAGLGMGNGAWQSDDNGKTALMYASLNGHSEIVELLIEHCDINDQDNQGKTALMYACYGHHFDTAKLLLSKSADKDIKDMHGYSIVASKDEKIKHFFRHTEKHNPKLLASALQQFSFSEKLRYTNHPWEGVTLTYDQFIRDLREGWEKVEEDIKALSKPLHDEIKDLLFSDARGWSSKVIEQEIKKGNHNSTEISDLQMRLKSLIVIKQTDKELKLLKKFTKIKTELKQRPDFQITLDLDNIKKPSIDKFFTDASRLEQALKLILTDINENATEKTKDVVIKAKTINSKHNYVELKIIHINSFASVKVDKLEETIMENGGNFKSIYDNLTSVCDWSIDTRCSDGNRYKIDYLYPEVDSSKPHATKIEDSSRGFTHILRFYI